MGQQRQYTCAPRRWRAVAAVAAMLAGTAVAAIAAAPSSQAITPTVTGYQVVTGNAVDMNGPTSATASVQCPAGKTVLSGGAFAHSPLEVLQSTYPVSAITWSVTVTLPVDVGYTEHFTPYAVCADSASMGGPFDTFTTSTTVPAHGEAIVPVQCPTNDVALGGGVFGLDSSDRIVVSMRDSGDARIWRGGEVNTGNNASAMVVYAVCTLATAVSDYSAQYTQFGDPGSSLDQPVAGSTALSGTAGTPYCPPGTAAISAGGAVSDPFNAYMSSLIPAPQGDPHYWLVTSTELNPPMTPATQETMDICVKADLQIATTTTLAINPTHPGLNQLTTLTATVTPASGTAAPSGTVQFYDNGVLIGSGTLSGGVATMTYRFGTGSHSLVAKYLGDTVDSPQFAPSQSDPLVFSIDCTTTISGAHGAVIASSGLTCIRNATISGGITVVNGAQVDIEHSTVSGSIAMNAPGAARICGSTLASLTVSAATGFVMVGDPGSACGGNTISGSVSIANNKGGGSLINNKIGGGTSVSGNNPAWTVSGNHP